MPGRRSGIHRTGMLSGPRVFSLAEWPVEVGLVTAARLAELTASGGDAAAAPQPLSRGEALWLFDRRSGELAVGLRAFVQQAGLWGPALSLSSDAELIAFVRKEIAAGALLAFVQGTQPRRLGRRPRPASDSAPVPIRRAPPPGAAAEPEEEIEFLCPGPQALALAAAAEDGAPFCEECAKAAAARAGAGAA